MGIDPFQYFWEDVFKELARLAWHSFIFIWFLAACGAVIPGLWSGRWAWDIFLLGCAHLACLMLHRNRPSFLR